MFQIAGRVLAMKTEEQLLSAHEAACVTGIPTKQVRRIIDAGLLRDFVRKPKGTRMISKRALVGLKLAYETTEILTLEGRRRLVRRVLEDPDATAVQEDSVSVDLSSMKNDIDQGIASLEQAKKIVVSDKEILGGMPCFKGTRIAVHYIAAMRESGDQVDSIFKAYPTLNKEQVIAAEYFAKAYPPHLAYPPDYHPRKQPEWRRRARLHTSKIVKVDGSGWLCEVPN